ncbi:hypothetical protein Tco_0799278 [Tanacetum coccineum]
MSTPVFVDPESSTQTDGAQSSRVPVPLPEDPYEAIRQAYLDGTDTESEPFEDPIKTETPESPLTIAPPISLSKSTPPVLVPILRKTVRMVMRIPPAMSLGLSASMEEVAAMFESSFRTSELVEDSKEDDDDKDEEIEESMDSDSVSEDAEDEGPTTEDVVPVAGDEGLTAGVEGLGMDDESYGLDDESHAPSIQTPPSPEWTSSLLPISPSPSVIPSPISSRMIPLTIPSPVATPAITETKGFLTELGAQVKMQGELIHDYAVRLEELSPALFERSLEYEQERVAVTFEAIWRPVLALESWAGQTDTQRLAEVVDGVRRGKEPKGDA